MRERTTFFSERERGRPVQLMVASERVIMDSDVTVHLIVANTALTVQCLPPFDKCWHHQVEKRRRNSWLIKPVPRKVNVSCYNY